MTNKTRYVVDVSDLMNWHSHLSGIQRVVAEMAYRYEKEGAIFCYYEEATQQFYPLDSFTGHMERREAAMAPQGVAAIAESNTNKAKHFIKRAGSALAPPIAVKVARRIKHEIASSRQEGQPVVIRETFTFEKGDTILVFGGHWDKPHYTSVLAGIKKQYGTTVATVVYDLIPVYDRAHVAEEEHTRFPRYIKAISEFTDVVYVISESTKRDYLRFLKENDIKNKPKVQVVILGEDFSHKTPVKPDGFTAKDYVLAVSTIEVRKNYGLLYATYKRAKELGVTLPKLVIVGRQGWLAGDLYYQMVHDSDVSDSIQFIHNANDEALCWLYEHCLFTVYPSFYEGWGLPVAEAASYGKASAASSASSIPEVVGDAAVYFSPFSADECLAAFKRLMDDKERAKLEAKLKKRTPNNWDMAYEQTKKVL